MEIATYAIRMNADEIQNQKTVNKVKSLEGFLGIHPDFPFAFFLFDTKKNRDVAFVDLVKDYHCDLVPEIGYVDERYLKK